MSLDYTEDEMDGFEQVVSGTALTIETYVSPDGVVLSDGADSVRVSKAKSASKVFIEHDGVPYTFTVNGSTRTESVKLGIADLCANYTENGEFSF